MNDIGVRESVGECPHSSIEVVGVAQRRSFTASYKRRILDEVSRAGRGEIGLILRREGLYSSQLSKWREWRNMSQKKDSGLTNELKTENQRLQKENARLKLRLRKAEAMLDLQKKAAEIMSYEDESERSDS